jgi:hypothetical protein
LKGTHRQHETQYHLHFSFLVDDVDWDVAVNVGINDDNDLLRFKLVLDFRHSIIQTLRAAELGAQVLTGQQNYRRSIFFAAMFFPTRANGAM